MFLLLVISCGWLDHPTNGRKNDTNYLLGSTINFTCNEGYELTAGSQERTCQVSGAWSGDTPQCSQVTGLLPFRYHRLSLKNHYQGQGNLSMPWWPLTKATSLTWQNIGHEMSEFLEKLLFKSK